MRCRLDMAELHPPLGLKSNRVVGNWKKESYRHNILVLATENKTGWGNYLKPNSARTHRSAFAETTSLFRPETGSHENCFATDSRAS